MYIQVPTLEYKQNIALNKIGTSDCGWKRLFHGRIASDEIQPPITPMTNGTDT